MEKKSILTGALLASVMGVATANSLSNYSNLGSGSEVRANLTCCITGVKSTDLNCGEKKAADAKCADKKAADAKCGDKKAADAKCGDKKAADAKCGDKKAADAKCGDKKAADAKCGDKKAKTTTTKPKTN